MPTFGHQELRFDVPDQWWDEAGMAEFIPRSRAYPIDTPLFVGRNLREVSLADIRPIQRQLSHGVFNHDSLSGVHAKDRVIRILMGFKAGDLVPPVEVAANMEGDPFRFELKDGAHRFYLSIAVGYTHIPVIDAFDFGPPTVRIVPTQ